MNQKFEPDEDEIEAGSEDEEEEDLAGAGHAEASLEEILSKRTSIAEPEEEEESIFDMTHEEGVESLSVRPVPRQANEFVCSNCHLVKNQSQLADRKRILCRDCV